MSIELFLSIAGFVALLITGAWAMMKIVVRQFKDDLRARFEEQSVRFERIEEDTRRNERELLGLRAELPVQYMRREDHIRYETVINAKLDALAAKIDLVAERQQRAN